MSSNVRKGRDLPQTTYNHSFVSIPVNPLTGVGTQMQYVYMLACLHANMFTCWHVLHVYMFARWHAYMLAAFYMSSRLLLYSFTTLLFYNITTTLLLHYFTCLQHYYYFTFFTTLLLQHYYSTTLPFASLRLARSGRAQADIWKSPG